MEIPTDSEGIINQIVHLEEQLRVLEVRYRVHEQYNKDLKHNARVKAIETLIEALEGWLVGA